MKEMLLVPWNARKYLFKWNVIRKDTKLRNIIPILQQITTHTILWMLELNDESWLSMRSTISIMYIWLDDVLLEALYSVSRMGINCPSKYIFLYHRSLIWNHKDFTSTHETISKYEFLLLRIMEQNKWNRKILEFMNHTIVSISVRTKTYSLK